MMKNFIALIDQAIEIAIATQPDYNPAEKRLEHFIEMLNKLKSEAESGQLAPANNAQLGLARFVGDWVEPVDSPLKAVAWEIDQYYQQNM
jgi:hypothetical protein